MSKSHQGSFYTWGQNGRGKLGHDTADVPDDHKTLRGICLPTQIQQLGSQAADVSAGGWGFLLLDVEGSVYGIGSISDGGRAPYVPGRQFGGADNMPPIRNPRGAGMFGNRGPFPFRIGGVIHRDHRDNPPPETATATESGGMYGGGQPQDPANALDLPTEQVSNKPTDAEVREHWLLKFPEDTHPKIAAISSGRTRALALDNDNNIWQWDKTYYDNAARLQFSFGDKTIRKIAGGWEKAAAIVEGEGIVVWGDVHSNDNAPVRQVEHVTVPQTNLEDDRQVVDVAVGRDSLLFLDKKGDVYAVGLDSIDKGPVLLETFMTKLKLSNWKYEPKFVKLTGNLTHFALISDREDVFLTSSDTSLDAKSEPLVIPELQQKGCVSVVAGDHHFMALVEGGKILSWGCESQGCGDLGQGQGQAVMKLDGASESGLDLVLSKPTEIKVEGKALAIAAGGWQSAAIIANE